MKPILFDKTDTTFTTQGLGRLSDAISCKVAEERNGAYELEMEYPIDGIHWNDVQVSRIIVAKPNDSSDPQAFRIYRISKPLKKRCMVYAEHISYQLSYIPVMPFTAQSFALALNAMVANAAESCPFSVWTDKTVLGDYEVKVPTSFRALLGGQAGSVLDVYGTAEYEFDNYAIKAHLNRGTNRGVVLRYGKNITDLTQEESIANTITGICPYWRSPDGDTLVTLPEEVLWSSNASNFPYARTVPMDFSSDFEDPPSEAQLRSKAQAYIDNNDIGVPAVNISLSFIPLWQSEEYRELASLEHVALCDTITVKFEKLDVSATAKVVKTVYDVLRERYESIEIGDAKTTLAKQIAQIDSEVKSEVENTEAFLTGYVTTATEKIVGGKGGYVKFNYNANGYPEELLILSAATEATSQKIIRMNQAGIGFSSDYGVTYSSAWTIDGVFNADFIGAGSLSAARVTTGILQDSNGYTTFNLDTGVLTMTKGSITLGTAVNGVFPFSVSDSGVLTAVSATLTNASLSGTITTENGFYKSMLDSGYLRMYYDSTLYGQFGGGAWGANTQKRGLGMYLAEDASYMFFGRYETQAGSYIASYIINFNLSAQELGYTERHVFYSTARFLGGVFLSTTLEVTGAITAGSTITASGAINLTGANVNFDNGYGLRFKNTNGVYQLAMYMSSADRIFLASTAYPVQVYGSTTYIGSSAYPTIIDGSTIKATKMIQNGTVEVECTSGNLVSKNVTYDAAFAGAPTVVLTPVDLNGYVVRLGHTAVTSSGFTIKMQANATGTFVVHWIAVYQPSS